MSSPAAVLLIDVQEKLFGKVERADFLLKKLQTALTAFQILHLPIFVTEQYPEGLGRTLAAIQHCLPPSQEYLSKTTFSAYSIPKIKENPSQWIIMGIEAHVCVLQSAKELQEAGRQVAVLSDAISSRFPQDLASALAEMREMGIRVTTLETLLFELLHDAKAKEFKQISALIK